MNRRCNPERDQKPPILSGVFVPHISETGDPRHLLSFFFWFFQLTTAKTVSPIFTLDMSNGI